MNQYTSRENDATGLLYYRARYYDPVLKRFISSDPIGLAGGMNMYAYVEGDPVSLVDPLGLWSVTIGAYLGVGGQVTFGNDGGNGFMTGRFGFGLGGGASYNPKGSIPGPALQNPSSGGIVLSCSAEANFDAGPLSASLEKGVARNYSNAESATYGSASASGRDTLRGLGASGSFGGQITIYSGRK
jgi:RHS repeat-associated protein